MEAHDKLQTPVASRRGQSHRFILDKRLSHLQNHSGRYGEEDPKQQKGIRPWPFRS
jgi:hypothetical protein